MTGETPNSNDCIAVHGHFDDEPEESSRVAFGVYDWPVLTDGVPTHLRQVMGNTDPVTQSLRSQSQRASTAESLAVLVNSHPVWSVDVPDTIIQLEVASRWRDTWETILEYTGDSPSPQPTLNGPTTTSTQSQFAIHYIDGQDLHIPTKILDITTAPSYSEAIHTVSDTFTEFRTPPNWEFEIVEIADQHRYDSSSLELKTAPSPYE